MKRKKLVKTLKEMGCVFVRHGGNHDWYKNPESGISQPIARHTGKLLYFQDKNQLVNFIEKTVKLYLDFKPALCHFDEAFLEGIGYNG